MSRVTNLKTVFLKTMPPDEDMEHGVIYVSIPFQLAIHLCACGTCRQQTVTPLNLFPEDSRGWNYFVSGEQPDLLVTLTPSIGNFQMPCKSHYYVTLGQIVWC